MGEAFFQLMIPFLINAFGSDKTFWWHGFWCYALYNKTIHANEYTLLLGFQCSLLDYLLHTSGVVWSNGCKEATIFADPDRF